MSNQKNELTVYQVGNTALFRVHYVGGGETPDMLKGMYTAPALAQKDIDKYKEEQKSKKNSYVEQRKADIKAEQEENKLAANA